MYVIKNMVICSRLQSYVQFKTKQFISEQFYESEMYFLQFLVISESLVSTKYHGEIGIYYLQIFDNLCTICLQRFSQYHMLYLTNQSNLFHLSILST